MVESQSEAAIVRRAADNLYGSGQKIWNCSDRWNAHKIERIGRFVVNTKAANSPARVLDAGSGSTCYTWMPPARVSMDRFFSQVANKRKAVVGELEMLPFADEAFDLVFCVGAVIDYVSAPAAINELSRVTRAGGRLYLHFESSSSFEQLGRSSWNAPTYLHDTINSSRPDNIWIYSPEFIYGSLRMARFKILRVEGFHILSALLLRLGVSQNNAARAAFVDRGASLLKRFADDVIVLAEKT
jgi:SAM-dependent methyltransferase